MKWLHLTISTVYVYFFNLDEGLQSITLSLSLIVSLVNRSVLSEKNETLLYMTTLWIWQVKGPERAANVMKQIERMKHSSDIVRLGFDPRCWRSVAHYVTSWAMETPSKFAGSCFY